MRISLAEFVLPGPQHREYLKRLRQRPAGMSFGGDAHAGYVATQKGIDLDLEAQVRRQTGTAQGADAIYAFLVIPGGAIGRLDRQGKPQVGGGVFMAAKYL